MDLINMNNMEYIDFNDTSIPIGKRKQAYVKYAVSKGTDLTKAKTQANKKFGFNKKPGIFAIVEDCGRTGQRSFTGSEEIFQGYDLRKYMKSGYLYTDNYIDTNSITQIINKYKLDNWDIIYVTLIG